MAAARLCQCGCGEPAPLARQTDRQKGWVKGQPVRFVAGHSNRHRGPPPLKELLRRIAAKTEKTASCWLWQGAMDQTPSLLVQVNGRRSKLMVRRLLWLSRYGPIPRGQRIMTRAPYRRAVGVDDRN